MRASDETTEAIGDTLAGRGWSIFLSLLTKRVRDIRAVQLSNPALPLETYRSNATTLNSLFHLLEDFYSKAGDEMPETLKALFK